MRAALIAWFVLAAGCATARLELVPGAKREPLPSIELVDAQEQPRTAAQFLGKVVLLDFWATWCPPCVESLPVYNRWQTELSARGFTVMAVSVDEKWEGVAKFLAQYAPALTAYYDRDGKVAALLALPDMPTAFLVDHQGNVALRHTGFRTGDDTRLRDAIDRLLAEGEATATSTRT